MKGDGTGGGQVVGGVSHGGADLGLHRSSATKVVRSLVREAAGKGVVP